MSGPPMTPLEHRVRRRILRGLHARGPLTPGEIAAEVEQDLREVLYHLRVLAGHRMARESRSAQGRREASFESQITEKPEIIDLLAETRAEDEA